tara:strand:+ start:1318 stop:1842 length:525 start_codon:yes stop_codon:yes gene_type:complete
MATVKFSISATPIEVATVQQGTGPNIAATECFGTVGGSGEDTSITIEATGGANDGYLNGAPYYLSATAVAESSAVLLTDLANVRWVYFKNTGYQYGSTSALGSTANTVDYLSIQTNSASNERVTIARLKAGEAIMLPVRKGCTLNEFAICSSDGGNEDGTTGANTIAVEFMAFA